MAILNFEFKARTADIKKLEDQLLLLNPKFIGEDNQADTYFNVAKGRLKLREGNIENSLIWYERENIAGNGNGKKDKADRYPRLQNNSRKYNSRHRA